MRDLCRSIARENLEEMGEDCPDDHRDRHCMAPTLATSTSGESGESVAGYLIPCSV